MTESPEKRSRSKRPLAYVALAVALALSFVTLAYSPAVEPVRADDVDIPYLTGLEVLAEYSVQLSLELYNLFTGSNAQAALSANKATYQNAIITNFNNAKNFATAHVSELTANYEADQFLLTRRAEYVARELYLQQTAAGQAYNYDPNWVWSNTGLESYIMSMLKTPQAYYTTTLNTLANEPAKFIGDFDSMYFDMEIGYGSPVTTQHIRFDESSHTNPHFLVLPFIENTNYQNSRLHINNETELYVMAKAAGSKTLNMEDDSGATVLTWTFNATAAGELFQLTFPDDLDDSKVYYFDNTNFLASTRDFYMFGYAMPAMTGTAAKMHSENWLCYDVTADGRKIVTFVLGRTSTTSAYYAIPNVSGTMTYSPSYGSVTMRIYGGSATANIFDLNARIGNVIDYYNCLNSIRTTANVAAQTYYNLLVASGDDGRYGQLPDIMFPDPTQMEGLTVEQMWALLLTYRQQMADYFQSSAYMNLGNATFSPNSLSLYCRGAIYAADGTPIYDNQTIWTPFVNVAQENLKVGENNTFENSMTLVKWGSAATIGAFLSVNASTADMRWSYPAPGAYAIIEEMFFEGAPVTDVTLALSTYEVFEPDYPDGLDPGQSDDYDDDDESNWFAANWYWFAVGAGVVLMVGAVMFRNGPLAAAALLVLVIGLGGYLIVNELPDWIDSLWRLR